MKKHINEVTEKLSIQQNALIEVSEEIYKNEPTVNDRNLFLFSVIKRAIDVIDTFNYATRTYNLNTQLPLLRLQIDNCLILKAAIILKDEKTIYFEVTEPKFQIKNYKHPVTGDKLSERGLAKDISNQFPDFLSLYSFCCNFVHFSRKAIHATVSAKSPLTFCVDVSVGNKDLKEDVLNNANSMIAVNKVLARLIEDAYSELPKNSEEDSQ